jgi:3-deoxy-D-manno-octulosonic-acid transferase
VGKLFYNISVRSYYLAVLLASPFQNKARLWIKGRKNQKIGSFSNSIWFHCASLGEFEQAKPVIERIKQRDPALSIVITFFSPSGYENRKEYSKADGVYYLPLDKRSNARDFLDRIKPKAAIFVKYEVWYNYFSELNQRGISLYLISATFRKEQIYFKGFGKFMKNTLKMCNLICTQNQESLDLLLKHGFSNAVMTGDTRYDRVLDQLGSVNHNSRIESFKSDQLLVIAGSSWQKEEILLSNFIQDNAGRDVKYIIAPHDIQDKHIQEIQAKFGVTTERFTEMPKQNAQVMILDTIGQLASAYHYADIAIIGGGFSNALHNILEPATFGIPVMYGNNHSKFPEGMELARTGGGFSVSENEFSSALDALITDEAKRQKAGNNSRSFVESKGGATEKLLQQIKELN